MNFEELDNGAEPRDMLLFVFRLLVDLRDGALDDLVDDRRSGMTRTGMAPLLRTSLRDLPLDDLDVVVVLTVVFEAKLLCRRSGIGDLLCISLCCGSVETTVETSEVGAELLLDWSEKSRRPLYFLVCRKVLRRRGGASTTRASMTVEDIERPDIADSLLRSAVDGYSSFGAAVGHAIRSPNFFSFLSNRCFAILSCKGSPLITFVAAVGDTMSFSTTSSAGPSVNIYDFRPLFRTVTFLIKLSSHSRSTLAASSSPPDIHSNSANSAASVVALGVVAPSSDSRPKPSPTSLRF